MGTQSLDWRVIEKELKEQGWAIKSRDGGKHVFCVPPDKDKPLVRLSTNSGAPRAIKNALSQLRNSGYEPGKPPPSKPQPPEPPKKAPPPGEPPWAPEPEKPLFSVLLRKLRSKHSLTQVGLAELCNVHPTTVNGWENGRFVPSSATFKQLIDLLPELKMAKPDGMLQTDVKPGRKSQSGEEPEPEPEPPPETVKHPMQHSLPPETKPEPPSRPELDSGEVLQRCVGMLNTLFSRKTSERRWSVCVSELENGFWVCAPYIEDAKVADDKVIEEISVRGPDVPRAAWALADKLKRTIQERRSALDALMEGL